MGRIVDRRVIFRAISAEDVRYVHRSDISAYEIEVGVFEGAVVGSPRVYKGA